MTALVEVLIGDWYGERERRAVAERIIFADLGWDPYKNRSFAKWSKLA